MKEPEELYLDLLEKSLCDLIRPAEFEPCRPAGGGLRRRAERALLAALRAVLARRGLDVARRARHDPALRADGRDWPAAAETMIGTRRLGHLRGCVRSVVREGVPGDLVECGVWRGGASILMRAALAAYGDATRSVWLADSFRGLPPPSPGEFPADAGDAHHTYAKLAVPLEEVRANFERYGLLDGRVKFLPGWFRDTLPAAPVGRIAVLRADGDMYESTTQILESLYPKLSPGGYCVIDDYGGIPACRRATDDYRAKHGISEPVVAIDWTGVFWRRAGAGGAGNP